MTNQPKPDRHHPAEPPGHIEYDDSRESSGESGVPAAPARDGAPEPQNTDPHPTDGERDSRRRERLRHFEKEKPATREAAIFMGVSRVVTAFGLITCAGFVVYGFATGLFDSIPKLRAFLDSMGFLAPVGYIGLSAAQSIFPILPGGITVIAAPVLFGAVRGSIYSYLGVVAGSIGAFWIGRTLGIPVLRARFSPKTLEKYLGWLTHPHFTRYFAIAIGLPLAPDDFLCYLAGLTTMRTRTFVLIIVLLKPWSILAYSFGVLGIIKWLFPGLGA